VQLSNPGDNAVTVNSYGTGTGNFSVTNYNCPSLPFQIGLNNNSYSSLEVQFTPASAATLTDTLTLSGSFTPVTVSLSGTGVTATETLAFTPPR
jgi:hypothetical protein